MNKTLFWIAVVAVIVVAMVAGVVSYDHLHTVAVAAGEQPWIAKLVPLSADGLLISASLSAFVAKWQNRKVHGMTKLSLAVGLSASVAANIASPFVSGLTGTSRDILTAIVGAWPAVALALSFEESLRLSAMRKSDRNSGMPIPAFRNGHTATFVAPEGKDTREEVSEASSASLAGTLPTSSWLRDSEVIAEPETEVPTAAEVVEAPRVETLATPEVISLPETAVRKSGSDRKSVATAGNEFGGSPNARKSGNAGTSVKAEALAYLALKPNTTAADLAVRFDRSERWGRGLRKEFQDTHVLLSA